MLELIITLAILIPVITAVTIYVTEYREISLHKKEMEAEWNKYINEPSCKSEQTKTSKAELF